MNKKNKPMSIYVHVPFCRSKCYYCDFVSTVASEEKMIDYFEALKQEAEFYALSDEISSIYIGGGTPSAVPDYLIVNLIEALNKSFNLSSDCEISMEANPCSLGVENLLSYKTVGINRLSVGVQATQDDILKRIGRAHTHEDTMRAVDIINKVGIKNFNLDLMFSLPGQTLENFSDSLDFAIQSGATHISAYSLTLEENTPIYDLYKNKTYVQDDELDRRMYHMANKKLGKAGFERYEISNFAKEGYYCRHNMYCWEFCDYLGFGAAAHSFIRNARFANMPDVDDYMQGVYEFDQSTEEERESEEQLMGDFIMLALRTVKGLDIKSFEERFGVNFEAKYESTVKRFIKEKMLKRKDDRLFLTEKGFDFANTIMCEFL